MENREKRFGQDWLEKQATKNTVSPGSYDTLAYAAKESFNYGSIPFGS